MRTTIVLVPTLLLIALASPTQTTNPDARIVQPRHAPSRRAPQKPEATPAQPAPAADRQDVEALRSDLEHMRVLLNQMRTNLAFVQTSDTPLKHQFDLNNEMWQTLLNDMDRRLQRMAAPAQR